jgi:prepilin peptidase dependent protein B
MLIANLKKKAGFTLVELMIALTLNAILLAALLTVFISNLNYYHQFLNQSRLNLQLQNALNVMASDIRRAGYSSTAFNDIGLDQNTNPFMAAGIDVTTNIANDCILFSYDQNNDGTLPTISSAYDDERYGYRLMNQTLQTRPPGAPFSCTAASSSWENMTDPNIMLITNLSFTLSTKTVTTGPGSRGVSIRTVTIAITGQLKNNSSVTKTLTQQVRIQNDKFIP